jgi:hypothetical protein
MDIVTLANQVTLALTPLLPFLGGVGVSVGNSVISKLGEDVYDLSKEQGNRLYQIVKDRFEGEKATDGGKASKALQNFVEDPEDYTDIFRKRLEALLQNDPPFAEILDHMLQQSPILRQVILLGESAVAENNEQINTLGIGEQRLELQKEARATGNRQTISGFS